MLPSTHVVKRSDRARLWSGRGTNLSLGGFVCIVLLGAGCGTGSSGGTTACTFGSGAAQTCEETSSSEVVSGGIAQAKSDCVNEGGVASDTCSHVGADGGCKVSSSGGGITLSSTTWYYAGQAASEMSQCTGNGDTWLSP
jgi:hypothetical protein